MSFECFHCGKHFSSKERVKRHILLQICLKKTYQCWCGKGYVTGRGLRLHKYKKHTNLMQRVRHYRHKELETIPFTFDNMSEFLLWKEAIEEETVTKFVKPRGSKVLRDGTKKTLYVCHRSGNVRVTGNLRKRRPPKKGSCKINGFCPAFISIEEYVNGIVKGVFHNSHTDHGYEIKHLSLTKAEKNKIADALSKGATFEEVLQNHHNNFNKLDDDSLKRIHALTRKDLHNIMQEFKIAFKEQLASDATNILSLVEECNERFGDNSPIRLFKPHNVECSEETDGANPEDFILIIMTPGQAKMLNRFDGKQIAIDGTHGSKRYDLNLTTLSCILSSNLNIPLAYCISNVVNEKIMQIFFSTLMRESSLIYASVFITEDYSMYINAWRRVVGVPEKWQVDKNLPDTLTKQNGLIELRSEMNSMLRSIMAELDDQIISTLIKKFIPKLLETESTQMFAQYFEKEFADQSSTYSYEYRKHTEIHTSVKLDSIHRVLRDVYFKGMKVRRIDFNIFRLLKSCWDNFFNKLPDIHVENDIYALKVLKSRHNAALSISYENIVQIDQGYEIKSQSDSNRTYLVQKEAIDCSCQLRCIECNMCFHEYSCTCVDYYAMGNFCKHVHAVKTFSIVKTKNCVKPANNNGDVIYAIENIKISEVEAQSTYKDKLNDTLLQLTHLLQTNTYKLSEYEEGAKLLQQALNIFYEIKPLKAENPKCLLRPIKKTSSSFSCESENQLESKDEELIQNHVKVEKVDSIDGVEEIVYVDVYTTNDEYL